MLAYPPAQLIADVGIAVTVSAETVTVQGQRTVCTPSLTLATSVYPPLMLPLSSSASIQWPTENWSVKFRAQNILDQTTRIDQRSSEGQTVRILEQQVGATFLFDIKYEL